MLGGAHTSSAEGGQGSELTFVYHTHKYFVNSQQPSYRKTPQVVAIPVGFNTPLDVAVMVQEEVRAHPDIPFATIAITAIPIRSARKR